MSFVKQSSIIVALVATAIVTVALGVVLGWRPGESWISLLVVGAVCGVSIGVAQWFLIGSFEGELRRLADHIEAIVSGKATVQSLRLHHGVNEFAVAVEQASTAANARLQKLTTRRRELEVQARLAEAERTHLEAILNTISDAVIVTDAFNEIALANESDARVLEFELDPSIRRPVDEVLHQPKLSKLIKETREGGNAALRRHVEHRTGNGANEAIYDVTLSSVSRPDHADNIGPVSGSGVVTVLRDVTRERMIAESKSDFVSNVSHELRTPITSIKAYVEMLIDGEANDQTTRDEFYNIIQGETNRLSRLIDNILNISRIESGIVKVQREHVALPALIKEAVDILQPQARAKRINLVEEPSPLYFQVFADRDMILQCLLNLVGNAIKYTSDGGRVSVSVTVDEHARKVQVDVTDSGVGIPPDALDHLFDKFYRVADHKNMAIGTGLGLSLVKHVIETVHDGTIGVTSEPNKGSTFTFALPIADN